MSVTSDPDSGPHACYPTSVPGSRQATFTRLIRGVVGFSRNFYALGPPRDVQQAMSTLVEPLKVTEAGVAVVMITADRSHSAAMAQLSLPRVGRASSGRLGDRFAARVAAPGLDALPQRDGCDHQSSDRISPAPTQQSVQQQADQQHRDDAIGAILISKACLDAPDRHCAETIGAHALPAPIYPPGGI
jgi:hypothetical protein